MVKNYDSTSNLEWKDEDDVIILPGDENTAKLVTGITERGFHILIKALIERGRQDTVWILLRTFGYDNNLQMGRETGPFFLPNDINLRDDDVTELSDEARHFLAVLFDRMDLDQDNLLDGKEQKMLFRPLPIPPWHRSNLNWQVECEYPSKITLSGFLAWYDYKTFFESRSVLCDLAYLGFPILSEHPLESAIEIKNKRQASTRIHQNKSQYRTPYGSPLISRRVFLVKIIGARYSGKTVLMQGLLNHDLATCHKISPKNQPAIVVAEVGINGSNYVEEENDYFVSLILNKVPYQHVVSKNYDSELIEDADVIGLVYNPSEESSYAESLQLYEKLRQIFGDFWAKILTFFAKFWLKTFEGLKKPKIAFFPSVKKSGIPTILISSNRVNEPKTILPKKVLQDMKTLNSEKSKRQGNILYGPVDFDPLNLDKNFYSIFAKMAVDPELLYRQEIYMPIKKNPNNSNQNASNNCGVNQVSQFGINSKNILQQNLVNKSNNNSSSSEYNLNQYHKSKSLTSLNTNSKKITEAYNNSKSENTSLLSLDNLSTTAVVLAAAGIVTGLILSQKNL